MRYDNFLVVGGSGFVGRHLVSALAARGARIVVPTRRRERAKHLILLPTVDVVEVERLDAATLTRLAQGRDAVINLAGVLHARRGRKHERGPNNYSPDFALAHVELPQAVITACRAAGVKRLIHMSALGADPQGPSEYLRSKGVGEQLVRAAGDLDATVLRPSVIFGPEDRFLNLFEQLTQLFPVLGLASAEARFQPVYVGDVVRVCLEALDSRAAIRASYDLCGPQEATLRDLVRYVCEVTGRRRVIFGLPEGIARLQAWAMEQMPVQLLTRDNLDSMKVPSVCDCAFPFGISPVPLEVAAPAWLAPASPRDRLPQLRLKSRR